MGKSLAPFAIGYDGTRWCVLCGGRPHKATGVPAERCRRRVLKRSAKIERLHAKLQAQRATDRPWPEYTGDGE